MKPKILLVDDETNILKRLTGVLFGTGQCADRAVSPAAAAKMMNRKQYDLVICHLRDKRAAHDLLKEIATGFPSTRTMLLSVAERCEDSQRLIDSGAVNRFLQTPVHKRLLRAAILEQLRLQKARGDLYQEEQNSYLSSDLLSYSPGGQPC